MSNSVSSRLADTTGNKINVVGAVVEEIRFSAGGAVRMILRGGYEKRFELAFEGEMILRRNGEEWRLTGANPGADYSPQSCGSLLALLGLSIERVSIEKREGLHLYFAQQWELIADMDDYDDPVWRLRFLKSSLD